MGDPFGFFNIFVAKHQKIEGGPFEVIKIFSKKISQCRKKLEGWTLWNLLTSILSQNIKKIEGGPFGFKKSKSPTMPKKLEGWTLWIF